ncbi:MAG: DNA internalization-related competence protein ComEC/Rec2 [Desulfobacula sp.]|nr:DNA internalization-related competence protein ComEC/Rec2 [Desulfobacula sp.]
MVGIYSGNRLPEIDDWKFPVLIALSALFVLTWFLKRKASFLCILFIIFSFGFFSIQAKVYPDLPDDHISLYFNIKNTIVQGKIISFARHYKRRVKTILLCQQIRIPGQGVKKVSGKIDLSIYFSSGVGLLPQYGDIIEFKTTIRSPENFKNPGAFDYVRYLKLRGLSGRAYCSQKNISIQEEEKQKNLFACILRAIEKIRTNFYYFIIEKTQASENSEHAKILAALITGKSELIDNNTRESFSRTGISHLFAISGLHLAIIALIFYTIAYGCLSYFPKYLVSGKAKKLAGITILFPLLIYALFSGFSPSTQRAFIMTTVFMFAFISEKEKDILSAISIAGIIILIMDPAALFSISFQLSFMAVIFIVIGLSLIKKNKSAFKPSLISRALMLLCISFFAALGTAPLIAHYFHMISLIQIISNLFFIPLIGFIILPSGLAALIFFPLIPGLSAWIIHMAHYLMSACIRFSEIISAIPFSWIRVMAFDISEILAAYMLMFLTYTGIKKQKKTFGIIFILLVILFINIFSKSSPLDVPKNKMLITLLDVGQGNSGLIETAQGQRILVDGGGFPGSSTFDTGKFIIAPFLWQKRIDTLDLVILTHPESDHLKGLLYILENFEVHKLIKNTDHTYLSSYRKMIEICKKKKISIIEISDTNKSIFVGDTQLFFPSGANSLSPNNLNNNSLVFKLSRGNFSMLFPGDILESREKQLASLYGDKLHSNILLSPHHGSLSSSSRQFLENVRPERVIVSCGRNNSYNFPHAEVLKRYNNINSRIFRTDLDGAVFILSDGKTYTITSYGER